MGAAKKITSTWGNRLLDGTQSLGNTGESILDKISDLLNDYCRTQKEVEEIAERAGLNPATIRRFMDKTPTELDNDYDPKGDSMSRILIVFGAVINWSTTTIKPQYMPQPKEKF